MNLRYFERRTEVVRAYVRAENGCEETNHFVKPSAIELARIAEARNGRKKFDVFVKPNGQSRACASFAMARNGRMKFNDMKQHDANDWKSRLGMVYSTDPDFRYTTDEVEEPETLPPDKQTLRVWLDRKQRAGRVVTLVRGFRGTAADLEALGRMLKQRCGVGGSVKEGEIIVQGDHRDRIVEILLRAGYGCKKAGG